MARSHIITTRYKQTFASTSNFILKPILADDVHVALLWWYPRRSLLPSDYLSFATKPSVKYTSTLVNFVGLACKQLYWNEDISLGLFCSIGRNDFSGFTIALQFTRIYIVSFSHEETFHSRATLTWPGSPIFIGIDTNWLGQFLLFMYESIKNISN